MATRGAAYEAEKRAVAEALRRRERSLAALVDALSHAETELNVGGVRHRATALARVCDAYLGIDNSDAKQGGAAQAVLGVVGAPAHVIARAIEVNEAKAALKKCCGPLQQRRMSARRRQADVSHPTDAEGCRAPAAQPARGVPQDPSVGEASEEGRIRQG